MFARHPSDTAIAHDVIAERIQHAECVRLARSVRRHERQAGPLRPVGRLLVRLGIYLGAEPVTRAPERTLTPVRPR